MTLAAPEIEVLDGVFAPDERIVVLSESFCQSALVTGDLDEAVRKALAAMALTGQRIAYLGLK